MTDGWAVEVTMERLGGGQPFVELWYAAIEDEKAATDAVKQVAQQTSDVKVTAKEKLSANALTGVGLTAGKVGRWL